MFVRTSCLAVLAGLTLAVNQSPAIASHASHGSAAEACDASAGDPAISALAKRCRHVAKPIGNAAAQGKPTSWLGRFTAPALLGGR